MDKDFLEQAKEMLNAELFKLDEFFFENFPGFSAKFKENFQQVCESITKLQNDNKLDEIAYLDYTMLRANIINKDYVAEVFVYGENWFLCENQCAVGRFDISFIFKYFDELWKKLLFKGSRYIGTVKANEVNEFMMDVAPKFYSYLASLYRFSILDCIDKDYFIKIKKYPQFEINAGEYMAFTEAVYKENSEKNREKCIEWFAKRLDPDYCFEDFSGLDFSGLDFCNTNFNRSDFRNALLKNTNFTEADLVGARFCGADLENACFASACLHESDFSGANLRNCEFSNSFASLGRLYDVDWILPSYFGINFRKADLRNADFRGAELEDADFTGAIMDSAKFDVNAKESLKLTSEQLKTVLFIDSD